MQLGLFRPPPAVKALMISLAVIPALLWLAAAFGYPLIAWTAMDSTAVMRGQIWRPFTYIFSYAGPSLRWLFSILALWMFASPLERTLGSAKFVRLFLLCGLAGGLGMVAQGLLAQAGVGTPALWGGADLSLIGLFIAFSLLFPDEVVSLLLFVVLVPVPGRYVGVVFTLLTWLATQCPLSAVVGAVMMSWVMVRRGLWFEGSRFQRKSKARKKSRLQFVAPSAQKVTPIRPDPELFRQLPHEDNEVDRILDKLRDEGMGALSPEERATLDAHSRKLRQRDGL